MQLKRAKETRHTYNYCLDVHMYMFDAKFMHMYSMYYIGIYLGEIVTELKLMCLFRAKH